MKDIDQDFFEQCVKESKSCKEALNKMGHSIKPTTSVSTNTKNIFNELCKKYDVGTSHFINYANKSDHVCSICGSKIAHTNKSKLCKNCKTEQKIQNWKNGVPLNILPTSKISDTIRNYIYQKQNQCCAICGIKNEWNGKELKFILDHINGNASNNEESNLRLICPNCDSQLDTYKSKNKNSARNRKKYTQIITE